MKKIKEKPKMGKAKEKPKSALLPRQAAHMMKEKYIKEMDQRPKGADSDTQRAPDQVEHAGRWAADELTGRAVEQGREYAKKKFAATRGEAQTHPDAVSPEAVPPAEGAPKDQPAPEYPPASPRERQAAERSPTAPKERPQAEHPASAPKDCQQTARHPTAPKERPQVEHPASFPRDRQQTMRHPTSLKERPQADHAPIPIKDRQTVEHRAAAQEQVQQPRRVQATWERHPSARDDPYPLKERPVARGFKERPTTDVPRTAARARSNSTAAPKGITGRASAAPRKPTEAAPLQARSRKAFKEKPPMPISERGAPARPGAGAAEKKPLVPKARRGALKSNVKPPAARPISPLARAKSAVQRQAQRQMLVQAKQTAKGTAATFRRVIQAVAKAASAATGAVSAIVGGGVLLVALVIVIVIAAVANSPFGLFFAQEPNAPNTVSVSQAVGSVNVAYNTSLEALQTGTYDSIDIQGAAPDWPDVLAVFAVKVAGADVGGMDVATLDPDRVAKLTAVFWDMTDVASTVETIPHTDSNPDDDVDDSWTERILHITITPKSADDMRTAYAFTSYQNSALDELLADRAALSSLAGSLSITSADVLAVLQALPDDLSPERQAVVEKVLSLVGKVNYFWGGKSYVIGWDPRWGTLQKVTSPGSSTSGTYRPYGLDCSGFLDWALRNAGLHSDGHWYIGRNLTAVSQADAQPGDFALYPDASHVGMIVGRNAAGKLLVCHCSYGMNNVVVTEFSASGFTAVGRQPLVPG